MIKFHRPNIGNGAKYIASDMYVSSVMVHMTSKIVILFPKIKCLLYAKQNKDKDKTGQGIRALYEGNIFLNLN